MNEVADGTDRAAAGPRDGNERHPVAAAARLPGVRSLLVAWTASVLAESLALVALLVVAHDEGGAGLVGAFTAARFLPALAVGPLVMSWADRCAPAVLLVAVLTVRAVLLGCGALLLAAGQSGEALLAGGLGAVLFVTHRPLNASLLPWLAPTPASLTAANVACAGVENAGFLVGPAVAALVLGGFGATEALMAAGVALVLGSCAAACIGRGEDRPWRADDGDTRTGLRAYGRDLAVGLNGLARQPMIMTLGFVQTFARGAVLVLFTVLALDSLRMGDSGVGLFAAALGIGGVLGAGAAAHVMLPRRLHRGFVGGVFLWGMPLLIVAVWPHAAVAVAAFLLIGVGNAMEDVALFTLLPTTADVRERGRVLGAFEFVVILGVSAGAYLTPLLVQVCGTRQACALIGMAVTLAALGWARHAVVGDRRSSWLQVASSA